MFKLKSLWKENDLNKIIKQQKKTKERIHILFTSLWDNRSDLIKKKIMKKYEASKAGTPVYVVDSFNLPHSFVIYNVQKTPCLVTLDRDKVECEEWISMMEKKLKV